MERVKLLLRRLSSPRNILPLVVILGAFVGAFDIKLFGATVRSEQIIMALLGFLAIDALVERLDLLTNIEQGIKTIQNRLKPPVLSDSFFAKKDFHSVENLIKDARKDVSIYGITLDTIVTLVPLLQEKLQQGCSVRILAPNPTGPSLPKVAEYFASRPEVIAARAKSNLDVLAYRLGQMQSSSLEIKTLDNVLLTGYIASDTATSRGCILIQLYMYCRVKSAPLFELSASADREWFPAYVKQFEQAWGDGVVYEGN